MSRTTCPHGMVDTCCENYNNCNLGRQAIAEVEPVAWMLLKEYAETAYAKDTNPPKRTWVGLTDDEIDALESATDTLEFPQTVRAIQAKLKEKNND